jgi:hypothetical protein
VRSRTRSGRDSGRSSRSGCRRWCQSGLRAIPPATAGNGIVVVDYSAPDDHVTARPDGCVNRSRSGRVAGAGRRPTVRVGIVPSPRIKLELMSLIKSAPNDHFGAGPDACRRVSGVRSIRGAGGCPTVRARIVSPTCVRPPAPDDHFGAGPHSDVKRSGVRSIRGAGRCPTVRGWVVSPTGVQVAERTLSTPYNHLIISPNCSVPVSAGGCIGCRGCEPAICVWIVSSAGIEIRSRRRRRCRRRISGGIVSPACV